MGKEMSIEEAEKAANMMKNLKPEDMKKMMKYAGHVQKGLGYLQELKTWAQTRSGMAFMLLFLAFILQYFEFI